MKKLYGLILSFLSIVLVINSCDYLDQKPEGFLDEDEVFKNRTTTQKYLANIYSNLPLGYAEYELFTAASDEMKHGWAPHYTQNINSGAWSPADNRDENWREWYQAISKSTIFLSHIDDVPMDVERRTQWKGQAIVLRAYYHFLLMKMYGPIPIVANRYSPNIDYTELKRAPVEDVFSFITEELDKAADILDMEITFALRGEISKAVALALKSKVLLFRASPLYNGNSDYNNFTNSAGEQLFPANYEANKWQEAADAAKIAIDQLDAAGYGLYKASNGDPLKSLKDLFLTGFNKEFIFGRTRGNPSHAETEMLPAQLGGSSQHQPTQGLVDSYEMRNGQQPILGYNPDGTPVINSSSGYTEQGYASQADPDGYYPEGISNMYVDRDPRFYASILYNGSIWKGQEIQFYYSGASGLDFGNHSETGYTSIKYSDPDVDVVQEIYTQKLWPLLRLAEVYLIYAEALNESQGPVSDVYKYINLIRDRAGMPDLPQGLTKSEMRNRIHHERRVELTFEGKRYFDSHRWKIAEETQSGLIYGMDISKGNSIQSDAFYQRREIEDRVFTVPKHYFWPISQREIERTNFVQNPGW